MAARYIASTIYSCMHHCIEFQGLSGSFQFEHAYTYVKKYTNSRAVWFIVKQHRLS
jgi:hypothetical protein